MKRDSIRMGEVMERFKSYVGMMAELIIIAVMYVIILPFKLLYGIGSKLNPR